MYLHKVFLGGHKRETLPFQCMPLSPLEFLAVCVLFFKHENKLTRTHARRNSLQLTICQPSLYITNRKWRWGAPKVTSGSCRVSEPVLAQGAASVKMHWPFIRNTPQITSVRLFKPSHLPKSVLQHRTAGAGGTYKNVKRLKLERSRSDNWVKGMLHWALLCVGNKLKPRWFQFP